MLNNFGPDYTLPVTATWLYRDPSLPWAMIVMVTTYVIGNRVSGIKHLVAPIFLSFLPLSIWLWDIPFSGRIICANFHGGQVSIAEGLTLSTKHFYALGATLYFVFTAYLFLRKKSNGLPPI